MSYDELLAGPVDFDDAGFLARLDALHRSRSDLPYGTVPLILLGAGSVMAQSFVRHACEHLNVVGVVDNARQGQTLYGHAVIGDAQLLALLSKTPDAIGVICAGSEKPAKHFQAQWGAHPGRLLFYFEILPYLGVSLDGNTFFNELQTYSDRNQVAALHRFGRSLFRDAESLRVLDAIMVYRLTWDAAALSGVSRPNSNIYLDSDLCPIGDAEIVVDGGAYDGDTVRAIHDHTGGRYRHIHAFELDPANFEALTARTHDMPNVTPYAAGLWSHADTITFSATGAMGSRIDASGQLQLPVDALDHFGIGEVTFIKLDIEGAEGAALTGMRETITRHKPKLALSAYHKADDLSHLIGLVQAMRDDYRFELRHYSGMIWDTVIYAA